MIDPTQPVRVISLWQPYASLVSWGIKRYETRSWRTGYRGQLLIHAAKRPIREGELSDELFDLVANLCENLLPLGGIVGFANMSACLPMNLELIKKQSPQELMCGDWQVGRYAWRMDGAIKLNPIPLRGQQSLWIPDKELIETVNAQLTQ